MEKERDCNSEARRLENLWSGEFGDAYTERNKAGGNGRFPFWQEIFAQCEIRRVLEVGCNFGANLRWIAALISSKEVFGIDVNQKALNELKLSMPNANVARALARGLPFRDRCSDLVFTIGVLIHQPPEILPIVMSEIVRCSRRYILCGEYYSKVPTKVPYRDQKEALFKRDFGDLYLELFPELHLLKKGFLPKEKGGWDDVTYWVFERRP